MKIYQIMYHDGYYGPWAMDNRVFTSKELAEKAFKENPPLQSDYFTFGPPNCCKLEEFDEDHSGYFIRELDLIDVQRWG